MHYRRNHLTTVIMRLDFPQLNVLLREDTPKFSDEISNRFPEVSSEQLSQIQFTMGPGASGINQEVLGFKWEHRNEPNGTKVVVLAPTFLSIEYTPGPYEHFPEFMKNWSAVFNAFTKHYEVEQFTRAGLRYINEIVIPDGNPLDWDGLISEGLITAVKSGETDNLEMTRSMHQYSAKRDDISVRFVYGIKNPEYPNAVARREFVLDYDCYISGVVERDEVLNRVSELNTICAEMFESSIEEGLRKRMEVIDNA